MRSIWLFGCLLWICEEITKRRQIKLRNKPWITKGTLISIKKIKDLNLNLIFYPLMQQKKTFLKILQYFNKSEASFKKVIFYSQNRKRTK